MHPNDKSYHDIDPIIMIINQLIRIGEQSGAVFF